MKDVTLKIYSKFHRTENNKKGFRTYFTVANMLVKGEEELGKQKKTITVKFTQDCDTKNIRRGKLIVKPENIGAPYKYEIKEDDDGNDVYPVIWIRGIEEYIEDEIDYQSMFSTDEEETPEVEFTTDEETGEVIE